MDAARPSIPSIKLNALMIDSIIKTVKINFLNKEKAYQETLKWQLINILFPLLTLVIFGFLFYYFRTFGKGKSIKS